MFAIGEKCADAMGLTQSRYQWVIDAAEREAYQEAEERAEEEEAMRELQEEEERRAAEEANALEGGVNRNPDDSVSKCQQAQLETVETAAEAPVSATTEIGHDATIQAPEVTTQVPEDTVQLEGSDTLSGKLCEMELN